MDRLLAASLTDEARKHYETDPSNMWYLGSLHRRIGQCLGPGGPLVLRTLSDMIKILWNFEAKVNHLDVSRSTVSQC